MHLSLPGHIDFANMPYIDKTGQVQDNLPINQQIVRFFLAIWNLIKLFWATLMGQDVNTAIQRTSRRSNGNGGNGSSTGSRGNDMNTLNRRNAPSVPGLYGEAPCCGR
ncbi:uncharacterized protein FA14DRAFT_180368 [Meira miltonrushii]|uniref:Selenoprotein K n=1 Tax=Meira miltonrushii TaxID=1280837 RepID=A0A316VCL5_9BASI|nr:uncharacterized protein FA14DRAFT_180368 [Meira miltonrushii]PWN33731.1 hypothetical protein FA14DRAFT_180368 [Meira miltonrushii]